MKLYREAIERKELSLAARQRMEFMQRLHEHVESTTPHRGWAIRLPHKSFPEVARMNLTLATCMVLGLSTAISFFFWWQQRPPTITSNALLVRAERWDTPSIALSRVVAFQAVRITTPKQTMERSIYRDMQGKRQFKHVKLARKEEELKSTLIQAGLDWDEPMSATSYQGWHDHQRVRRDKIVRAGKHLLTLTTTVPDGSIAEQSLTVRDTDFHPVRRTVAFRDSGIVEIAELDFKILPWDAVDASVFEPVINVERAATAPARVRSFPRLPEMLTEGQLDETELSARLILNQLHADAGEQIEIHRNPQGVEVAGLVDTEERRRALQTQLQTVPHLIFFIQSLADLQTLHGAQDEPSSIRTAAMTNQPSPLEAYLQMRGRSLSAINILAECLFNDALTISQESRAIDDLQTRFVADRKNVLASATLSELIYSHKERLQAALKQESEMLAEATGASGSEVWASLPTTSTFSLVAMASRNLTLSTDLTQTNSPATLSAEEILAEMSVSIKDLTIGVRNAHGKLQSESTLDGKK